MPVGRINPCGRSTVGSCPCVDCRHARYNPGPPSKPGGHYGHFKIGVARKRRARRLKVEAAHAAALIENYLRDVSAIVSAEAGIAVNLRLKGAA